MSVWTDFVTDVEALFTDAEKEALAFFAAAAKSIVASGGQLLLNAATQAVETAEATGGTGAEKFAAAEAAVTGTLASAGITAITGAVHAGIEAAVATMKAPSA